MLVFNITPDGGYRRPFPKFPWIQRITRLSNTEKRGNARKCYENITELNTIKKLHLSK
jgi:hypothetical protein